MIACEGAPEQTEALRGIHRSSGVRCRRFRHRRYAIANKHLRTAWAILAHGENYDPNAWRRHRRREAKIDHEVRSSYLSEESIHEVLGVGSRALRYSCCEA